MSKRRLKKHDAKLFFAKQGGDRQSRCGVNGQVLGLANFRGIAEAIGYTSLAQ